MQKFNAEAMASLVKLNERLKKIERKLCEVGRQESARLNARIEDHNDHLSDYEIEAELYYYLKEDDPKYQEDEDNILTKRTWISLKHLEHTQLDDGEDHRLINIGYPFSEMEQVWLFHDLWDHDFGPEQRALTAREMLQIGQIGVEIIVRHQMLLDVDGTWSNV
ncbi:hypothetical protein U5801_01000 [Lamprobacter modestohalophilus]|uniref:hypothetical protein n=1 Tax=Lamprobacter modestohalophilus TaxID=1064514 RepID=UPI002ADEEB41|nr:hypothetical protein [Lamprobacter modestohalophilus]MEA1048401.1 hypothetical protein [Lamprobacter modestohalophilus]